MKQSFKKLKKKVIPGKNESAWSQAILLLNTFLLSLIQKKEKSNSKKQNRTRKQS